MDKNVIPEHTCMGIWPYPIQVWTDTPVLKRKREIQNNELLSLHYHITITIEQHYNLECEAYIPCF